MVASVVAWSMMPEIFRLEATTFLICKIIKENHRRLEAPALQYDFALQVPKYWKSRGATSLWRDKTN